MEISSKISIAFMYLLKPNVMQKKPEKQWVNPEKTVLQMDGRRELNSTDPPAEPWIQKKKKESHFVLEILNYSRNVKFSYRGFSALATWPNKCNYQN